MPIYEYQCDRCSHEFEREQRMADPPVKTCPACKGRKVTKLISRSSFVLKGGGWYADGYADAKKAEKNDTGSEAKSGEAGEGASSDPSASDSKKSAAGDDGGKGKKKGKKEGKKSAA